MKLCYKGKEVLIIKALYSTHKKNIKKNRGTIIPIADTIRNCVCQNVLLRSHKDSTRVHLKVGQCGLINSGNQSVVIIIHSLLCLTWSNIRCFNQHY